MIDLKWMINLKTIYTFATKILKDLREKKLKEEGLKLECNI